MIEKTITDNLLAIAEAYSTATGKSLTQVSKDFYGNADFFVKLRAGARTVSVKKLDEMIKEFRDEWPAGAPWPKVGAVGMGRYETPAA